MFQNLAFLTEIQKVYQYYNLMLVYHSTQLSFLRSAFGLSIYEEVANSQSCTRRQKSVCE
jgi:hypothetical protein